jgi:hypothetical protein
MHLEKKLYSDAEDPSTSVQKYSILIVMAR